MRQPSLSANAGGQSPALVARVNEKKAELDNLKELRELSASVATQMEALEQKLATLSDGTEGVCVAAVTSSVSCVCRLLTDSSQPLPWCWATGIMC
jgi:DASH complex subunit DAD2